MAQIPTRSSPASVRPGPFARVPFLVLAGMLVAAAGGACAPPACSDTGERAALHDVELLVSANGPIAEAAEARLVRRGRDAIAALETGLYSAEAPARRRIVRALAAIGSAEAAPVLAHLARRDPDPGVRDAARSAFDALTHR